MRNVSPLILSALIGLIAVLSLLPEIQHPRFALIGDEFAFFDFANAIRSEPFSHFPLQPGVYTGNTSLVSFYQAFFLGVFEPTVAWWRFSSIALFFPAAIGMFLWLRAIWGTSAGLWGSFFFCVSFFARNFFLIPYPNSITPVAIVWLNFLFVQYVSCPELSFRRSAGLGALLGLATYLYLGPVIPLILSPYYFWFRLRHPDRKGGLHAVTLMVVAFSLSLVVLFGDGYLLDLISRSTGDSVTLSIRAANILRSFEALWSNQACSHFIYGSYLDAVSGVLAFAGLLACLTIRRHGATLMLVAGFAASALLFGLGSNGDGIAVTRGVLLLPYGFAFSALGADIIVRSFPAMLRPLLAVALALLIFLANEDRRSIFFSKVGIEEAACTAWELQDYRKEHPGLQLVVLKTNRGIDIDFYRFLFSGYGLGGLTFLTSDRNEEVQTDDKRLALDMERLNAGACRDKTPKDQFLPWLPLNLWGEE